MSSKRHLTGITTSGTPHLGNYVGAIRPAIIASQQPGASSFYFLADYHALIKCEDPERIQRSTLEIAATWLALGLDADKVYFYRQSDIPEIPELTWLLTCVTAKGVLNRAHAYKAATDANRANEEDIDAGINAGLYMYPVLMAADILMFNAARVPVGRDQIQHIEMARDIGQRFNHIYGEHFVLPEAVIEENVATLPGLDGRKMSKSYHNTIPLWLPQKELKKAILGIVTNSQTPGEAKDPNESHVFTLYQAFASAEETAAMRIAFAEGIGWGDAKQKLFERIDSELSAARVRYESLMTQPDEIETILLAGAAKAREIVTPWMTKLRAAVGLRRLIKAQPIVVKRAAEVTAGAVVTAELTVARKLARFISYREKSDHKFYYKVAAADGTLLLQSVPFATPQESGRAIIVLKSIHANELITQSIGAEWQVHSGDGKLLGMSIDPERLRSELESLRLSEG
jgi:tryptophanyl-tRNA synthetase